MDNVTYIIRGRKDDKNRCIFICSYQAYEYLYYLL